MCVQATAARLTAVAAAVEEEEEEEEEEDREEATKWRGSAQQAWNT
jgi:hypothetical protein